MSAKLGEEHPSLTYEEGLERVRAALDIDPYGLAILATLQGKHIYAGTVPYHVKLRRRARAKVARASRKANR